jgi:hypothetical protein
MAGLDPAIHAFAASLLQTEISIQSPGAVWYKSPFGNRWTTPMPETEPFTFIATTAGEATAELARRGLAPDQRVIITIEPDDWLSKARAFSRPLIEAEGWTDEE